MNCPIKWIGLIGFVLITESSFCQPPVTRPKTATLAARLNSILNAAVMEQQIPGAVLLVSKDSKIIHFRSYGYAQLFSADGKTKLKKAIPMTTKHLFDIASLTKVVGTTTGILLLNDRGMIELDAPVGRYIPGFATPDKSGITVRHLLTHTAGLYEWYPMYYRASNRKQVYDLIASLPLAFPVGKQRKYSDLGFTILGQLIEVISKKPLEQFLNEEVFNPLGMKQTLYNPNATLTNKKFAATSIGNPYEYRMAHDTTLGFRISEIDPDSWNKWRHYNLVGEVNDGNAWYAGQGVSGAAGLFSTAEDLYRLSQLWLNRGKLENKVFVQESTVNKFLTIDLFNNGIGWMMDSSNSFMKNAPAGSFGHTGFTGTSIAVVPSKKLIVILLINRQQTGLLPSLEYYNINPIRRQIFSEINSAIF